ncbi:MAG: hypothetical protein LBL72_03985 [Candidatus Accumulibacter sp.]|jgi:hypothetical protein|nr:hypothetical protein [Accumulibacter sp.]
MTAPKYTSFLFQFIHPLMPSRFTVPVVRQGEVDNGWDELELESRSRVVKRDSLARRGLNGLKDAPDGETRKRFSVLVPFAPVPPQKGARAAKFPRNTAFPGEKRVWHVSC